MTSGQAINYYEHHLGDYAEATAHLSLLEHGVYGQLIRKYYATEKPLPGSADALQRLILAKSASERSSLTRILAEFFYIGEDGLYHNARCDEELAKFKAKSSKARDNANARWHSNGNANGMRSHSNGNANDMLAPQRSHGIGNALQSPVSNPQSPVPISETSPNPLLGGGGGVDGDGRTRNPRRPYQRAKTADELEREEASRAG